MEKENLVGKKFNMLTVLEELPHYKIRCLCDCGNEKIIDKYKVKNGIIKSCGCLILKQRRFPKDYTGKKFGMLTITKELGKGKVLAKCDCGSEKIYTKSPIIAGKITSCGCQKTINKDYTGQKFNHLTVIKELGSGKILCRCDCGNIKEYVKNPVVKGNIKSCGCITREGFPRDLTGKKIGLLTVLYPTDATYKTFHCRCDCGNEKDISRGHLVSQDTKSCGCLRGKRFKENKQKSEFNNLNIKRILKTDANSNNTTSGIRGIIWAKERNKWNVYISRKNLGYYDTLEEAKKVRKEAEEKYFAPIIKEYFANKKAKVRKSYVGQKFNMLTILEELGGNKVLCRCDCGNVKILTKSTVIKGGTKSCGCLLAGRKIKSYIGKKFNHLTIIKEDGGYRTKAICQCDCGNIIEAKKQDVILGAKKYCGDKNCPYKTKRHVTSKENLVGKKFNMLTVLEEFSTIDSKGRSIKKLRCQCDCGNVVEVAKSNVTRGHTKSCGCLNKNRHMINRTGQKFGMLTIIKELGGNKVRCQCDCGNVVEVAKSNVTRGNTNSCGCLKINNLKKARAMRTIKKTTK
mgnify:CR=1 FL=1